MLGHIHIVPASCRSWNLSWITCRDIFHYALWRVAAWIWDWLICGLSFLINLSRGIRIATSSGQKATTWLQENRIRGLFPDHASQYCAWGPCNASAYAYIGRIDDGRGRCYSTFGAELRMRMLQRGTTMDPSHACNCSHLLSECNVRHHPSER